MASLGSSIRSAARATSSAYRRLPIRWRLAGGSAVLTLVILMGFAAVVGIATTRRIRADFNSQVRSAADDLGGRIVVRPGRNPQCVGPNLDVYGGAENAKIRVVTLSGDTICQSKGAPDLGFPRPNTGVDANGYRVYSRPIEIPLFGQAVLQFGRPLSDVDRTIDKVRLFLIFGVLAGAALALLAGLAMSRRAMAPIAELTGAAREVERTRDPGGRRLPHPEADDEVAELARTLEDMLGALDSSRAETEGMLARQRSFVADASHELRTPLTSVLANLELLADELEDEQGEAARAALRSSQRMRRLVADLLLLARADAGRITRHEPVDVAGVVTEAVGELEPVSEGHAITVSAPQGATISGARDELHRLALNLLENALRHTDPGTAVEASVERVNGQVIFSVEDDGPGIPPELHDKVFERFFRGAGDRSGSSGLGLAIVRSVAESHHGTVTLEDPLDGRGARFVVRFPAETSA